MWCVIDEFGFPWCDAVNTYEEACAEFEKIKQNKRVIDWGFEFEIVNTSELEWSEE